MNHMSTLIIHIYGYQENMEYMNVCMNQYEY